LYLLLSLLKCGKIREKIQTITIEIIQHLKKIIFITAGFISQHVGSTREFYIPSPNQKHSQGSMTRLSQKESVFEY